MIKRAEKKEDGRYIIFYEFTEESDEHLDEEHEPSSEKGGER